MPDVRCSKLVDADLSSNWNFVKEIDNWATLLPGYASHTKIDEFHSTWTVKGEVGVLARTVELAVSIDEWDEEDKVAFSLTGLTEVVTGGGVFRLLGPGSPITAEATAATPAAAQDKPASMGAPVRLSAGQVVRTLAMSAARLLSRLLTRLRDQAGAYRQPTSAAPAHSATTSPATTGTAKTSPTTSSSPAAPTAAEKVVPKGQSGFEFELKLVAGGMIGPVVNVMLEGMIAQVGRDFADNVANAIETGRA